jgi:hypothetical protein
MHKIFESENTMMYTLRLKDKYLVNRKSMNGCAQRRLSTEPSANRELSLFFTKCTCGFYATADTRFSLPCHSGRELR